MKIFSICLSSFCSAGLLLLLLPGCQRPAAPALKPPAEPAKTYRLIGRVTEIDRQAAEVTINHEAIPGYMAAMTMPFSVADRALLDDVRAGDEVEGLLRVTAEHSALVKLEVTRPAPLTLDLSGGAARLVPKVQELGPGQEVPDFSMTTQTGATLRLSDLRGKVVVLTFLYTRCPLPDFCPLMDRKFRELSGKVSALPGRAEGVRFLSVSFDPEHDTPEVLAQHAHAQGARPPVWTFAVASHPELAKVRPALGLDYAPGQNEISHNLCTALIDQQGKLVRLEHGRFWDTSVFFKAIVSLLPASQR